MAVGDDAAAVPWPILTPSVDLVKDGATEINRSRDFAAQVKALVPVGKPGFRAAAGITSGTAAPTGGSDGDIYFQIVP